jgi:hypothetical protein
MKVRLICLIGVAMIIGFMASGTAFAQCSFLDVSGSFVFPVPGGSSSFYVWTDSTCPWAVYSGGIYTNPTSGVGPGWVNFYIPYNYGHGRGGAIWVYSTDGWYYSDAVDIYQEGNPMSLIISPGEVTCPGNGLFNSDEGYISLDMRYTYNGNGPYFAGDYANMYTNGYGDYTHYWGPGCPAGTYVFDAVRNKNGGQWFTVSPQTIVLH